MNHTKEPAQLLLKNKRETNVIWVVHYNWQSGRFNNEVMLLSCCNALYQNLQVPSCLKHSKDAFNLGEAQISIFIIWDTMQPRKQRCGQFDRMLEWFSDKESQESLSSVIKTSRIQSALRGTRSPRWLCGAASVELLHLTAQLCWERCQWSWHLGMSCSSRTSGNTVVLCQPLGGLQHC